MAKKEFTFRGKTIEQIKNMGIDEYMMLIPSKERRKLKKGFTQEEKILLKNIRAKEGDIKTHCRDMVILPEMLGLTIKVFSGKEFQPVMIGEDMLGHRLGEFALTRRTVKHGAAGIGATKSSAHQSVK